MSAFLGGSSRQSLQVARGALDVAVKGATGAAAASLSADLFVVAKTLHGSLSLRRAITDPSRDAAAKATLVKDLFKSLSASAIDLTVKVSSLRWSSSGDLVQVLEQLAIEAQASAANIDGVLDRIEDELFTAEQSVTASPELRKALVTVGADDAKIGIIKDLFAKNASPYTVALLSQLVTTLRGRSIEVAFHDYKYALAARRNRVIALVRVAVALTDAQRDRLAASLTAQVGQPVRINIEVDPSVLGGVAIKFADELVDGTVVNRLASAGRSMARSN
jgi:F-type H+-transporting ATPase subunit delta